MEARRFDSSDQRQVQRAAVQAEDLTSRFYCIPGREWPRFPYDISTLSQGPGPERPVFADVVRLVRRETADARGSGDELYRIRLRDDQILAAVGERCEALFPLLLYVLTHELVHVVRFRSGLAAYEIDDPLVRGREELRVHTITRKVLQPAEDADLRRVAHLHFDSVGRQGE